MFTGYGNCYRLDALELAAEHGHTMQHWTFKTIEHFRSILANPEFPCLFGRKAVNGETCHILFARAEDASDRKNKPQALALYKEFLDKSPATVLPSQRKRACSRARRRSAVWRVCSSIALRAKGPHRRRRRI